MTANSTAVETPNISVPASASSGPRIFHAGVVKFTGRVVERGREVVELAAGVEQRDPGGDLHQLRDGDDEERAAGDDGPEPVAPHGRSLELRPD